MRTVFRASLRVYARRYVAAGISVAVAAAFVVVIGVLTTGWRAGLLDGAGAAFRGADHLVTHLDGAAALGYVESRGADDAAWTGRAMLSLEGADGERFPAVSVAPLAGAGPLRWQPLREGRFPKAADEAVVDVWAANEREIAVGDTVRVGKVDAVATVRVVGVVDSPSPAGQASLYVTFEQFLTWRDDPSLTISPVAVTGDAGRLPDGARVMDPDELLATVLAKHTGNVDTVTAVLLVFAGVAAFVSVLVIANTFGILLGRRQRELALLRCVGATRGQVAGAVRREALLVGSVASLAGVVLGIGLGYGLVAVIGALAPEMPLAYAAPSWTWLIGGLAAGIGVTLVASWLPTRRTVRVSPLAALRPAGAGGAHGGAGRRRLVPAVILVAGGGGLLVAAASRDSIVMLLAGGGAAFAGVMLAGPVLMPFLVRVAGRLLGPAGRLATTNAARNPHRTATTTASLLVGVTLTTAVLTGLETTRASVDLNHGTVHPLDVAISSAGRPLGPAVLEQAQGADGAAAAIAVDGVVGEIQEIKGPLLILTAPDAADVARDGGAFAEVEPGTIRLDPGAHGPVASELAGRVVSVRVGDRMTRLTVDDADLKGWGAAAMVAPETLAELGAVVRSRAVWVRAAADADPVALVDELDTLAARSGAEIADGLQAEAADEQQIASLTWLTLGLLGISVVIALIGIMNTLGLSVLERTREHALLRALGLTRRQLHRMLATEGMLLAVVAALLGTALGITFAWVGYETFVRTALVHGSTMRVAWWQLAVVVLATALAGLLAAAVPARGAARVAPAAGLSQD
ncbi:ABC transporter permease [Myceligenerans crystallogenes]|uniref:FtsX-like permease family protein n=1 Tax=Myceligenerans crystallogenes TaxID=316335 RepID=A0ABN2NM01_9MICO